MTCKCGHDRLDHIGECLVMVHQKAYGLDPGDDLIQCECERFESAESASERNYERSYTPE